MLQSPKRAQGAGVVTSLSSGNLSLMNKEIQIVYLLVAYIHLLLAAWHRPCSASTHLRQGSVSDVLQLLYITIRTEGVYCRLWPSVKVPVLCGDHKRPTPCYRTDRHSTVCGLDSEDRVANTTNIVNTRLKIFKHFYLFINV